MRRYGWERITAVVLERNRQQLRHHGSLLLCIFGSVLFVGYPAEWSEALCTDNRPGAEQLVKNSIIHQKIQHPARKAGEKRLPPPERNFVWNASV